MERIDSIPDVYLRYFPLKEDYVYAQLSSQLTQSNYQGLTGITPGQASRSLKGKGLILCLDKSGSMAGKPFEALKQGASIVGKSIFEANEFQTFATCFYDDKATTEAHNNAAKYQEMVTWSRAGGSTNFVNVFLQIEKFCKEFSIQDISIIFFTDGCDTCNNKSVINSALNKLKLFLTKEQITSRFLTIGFTSSHDAAFLNQIAQSGSELGNFFYVNTDQADYPDQIQQCLASSLSMAQSVEGLHLRLTSKSMEYKDKTVLAKSYAEESDEEEDQEGAMIKPKKEEAKTADVKLDFTTQILIREQCINDLESTLILPNKEIEVKIVY